MNYSQYRLLPTVAWCLLFGVVPEGRSSFISLDTTSHGSLSGDQLTLSKESGSRLQGVLPKRRP